MFNNINLDSFWISTARNGNFKLYSMQHIIPLCVILFIIFSMILSRDKLRTPYTRKRVGYFIGCILFIQSFFQIFWFFQSGTFTLQESLPLYLCRLTSILCIYMTIAGSYSVFEVVYFWGLVGASLALSTPDIGGFSFPHWIYFQFFIEHGSILVAICFMMVAYSYKPTINSLKKTLKYSFIYLFFIFIVNYLVNGNYSYLRNKPSAATILDYFPKYPYYIPIMILAMFLLFTILYIPFWFEYTKKRNSNTISMFSSYSEK